MVSGISTKISTFVELPKSAKQNGFRPPFSETKAVTAIKPFFFENINILRGKIMQNFRLQP